MEKLACDHLLGYKVVKSINSPKTINLFFLCDHLAESRKTVVGD